MSRLSGLLCVTVIYLSLFFGNEAVTIEILEPIRSTGDEVGLIFIPNTQFNGEQYNKTARAIQEASELKIWVALTSGYFFNDPNFYQVPNAFKNAMKLLRIAGMTSGNFVGVGHGNSGHHVQDYVKNSDLKAIILMGSTLPRETVRQSYPIPVLTLCAELDGLTRITRVVEEYDDLTEDTMWSFFQGLYRTPVILIEGSNHAQFASGLMPPFVQNEDLTSNITDEQARSMIGNHINDFLTVTFSTIDTQTDKALEKLTEAFLKSVKKLQPFLDVKYLDTDGRESMWTIIAQQHFAGEYANKTAIYNDILKNPSFFFKEPSLTTLEYAVVAGTATHISYPSTKKNPGQSQVPMVSPSEIAMKLVSNDAIWGALDSQNDTFLRSEPKTCESLNRLALYLALFISSKDARDRYFDRGQPIIFEQDVMRTANMFWVPEPLQMWYDEEGLHVRSFAMVTPKLHYCKVISPYRAMEWVNVDSLRPYSGSG